MDGSGTEPPDPAVSGDPERVAARRAAAHRRRRLAAKLRGLRNGDAAARAPDAPDDAEGVPSAAGDVQAAGGSDPDDLHITGTEVAQLFWST